VNAPAVTQTKVQNDKIVRALKKLSVTDPDETLIIKMVSAFLALGVNPQAKSLGFVATPGPVAAKEPVEVAVQGPAEVTGQEPATEQQEPTVEPKAKATKKAAKKE